MYEAHPSGRLNELFAHKPYQGVAPADATLLFVGLDANYAPDVESRSGFDRIVEYHTDGVAFWHKYGVHHPFLLPDYTGDGRKYHRSFARIGFAPEHADQVSFVELLHVPTVGRNKLAPEDFSGSHLQMLNDVILKGRAAHVFISPGVARLMRATRRFPWLPRLPAYRLGALNVWCEMKGKKVYAPLHFSVYGKFEQQKAVEAMAIRGLLDNAPLDACQKKPDRAPSGVVGIESDTPTSAKVEPAQSPLIAPMGMLQRALHFVRR